MKKRKIKKSSKKFKINRSKLEVCENYYVTNDINWDGRGET